MSDNGELSTGEVQRYAILFSNGVTNMSAWQAANFNFKEGYFDGLDVILFATKAAAKEWFRKFINLPGVSSDASAELHKTSDPFVMPEMEPEETWFVSPYIRNGEVTIKVWGNKPFKRG